MDLGEENIGKVERSEGKGTEGKERKRRKGRRRRGMEIRGVCVTGFRVGGQAPLCMFFFCLSILFVTLYVGDLVVHENFISSDYSIFH